MNHPYQELTQPQVQVLQRAVRKRLRKLSFYSSGDETLLEYTMLILRTKNKSQLQDDLSTFLEEETEQFVDWLWQCLCSIATGTFTEEVQDQHQSQEGLLQTQSPLQPQLQSPDPKDKLPDTHYEPNKDYDTDGNSHAHREREKRVRDWSPPDDAGRGDKRYRRDPYAYADRRRDSREKGDYADRRDYNSDDWPRDGDRDRDRYGYRDGRPGDRYRDRYTGDRDRYGVDRFRGDSYGDNRYRGDKYIDDRHGGRRYERYGGRHEISRQNPAEGGRSYQDRREDRLPAFTREEHTSNTVYRSTANIPRAYFNREFGRLKSDLIQNEEIRKDNNRQADEEWERIREEEENLPHILSITRDPEDNKGKVVIINRVFHQEQVPIVETSSWKRQIFVDKSKPRNVEPEEKVEDEKAKKLAELRAKIQRLKQADIDKTQEVKREFVLPPQLTMEQLELAKQILRQNKRKRSRPSVSEINANDQASNEYFEEEYEDEGLEWDDEEEGEKEEEEEYEEKEYAEEETDVRVVGLGHKPRERRVVLGRGSGFPTQFDFGRGRRRGIRGRGRGRGARGRGAGHKRVRTEERIEAVIGEVSVDSALPNLNISKRGNIVYMPAPLIPHQPGK